jgi:hypothetical protein
VQAAYRAACQTPVGDIGSFWLHEFAEAKRSEHNALLSSGSAASILRRPGEGMLFWGFDGLHAKQAHDQHTADYEASWAYDNLLRLAEALGVLPLEFPEAPPKAPPLAVEPLLDTLDAALGFRIDFPNPFPGEIGLSTSRGVCSYRCPQALFQAWRIASLLPDRAAAHVVEIGPGLGRNAYYARKLGIGRYTLIDIPLSGAAQGYFLGRVLGEDAIRLFGEEIDAPVRVMPPSVFLDGTERFDLVVNADSLTEMARPTAEAYWQRIQSAAPAFLAINHEYNDFRFRDIYTATGHTAERQPYWMRRGFVEELVRLG